VGTDALSPCRFYDVMSPDDLKKMVDLLRDVTDYRKPMIIKLGPGRIYDDVKIAASAGADAVAVDGKPGGTGAAPDIVSNNTGIPTIATIPPAVKALKELGLYRKVKLISLGGYRNGADVVRGLALGADVIGISSAAMIAMGCRVCEQCSKGMCPLGITAQDPELRRRLHPERAAKKLQNFLNAITEEVKMLTMLSGHKSIAELSGEDLRALSLNSAAMCGVKLVGLEDYVMPLRKHV
jgi:glutamate synthase domain-containing protein 2